MSTPQVAPCGSWRSPIAATAVAAASVRFGHLGVAGGTLYWVEGRPAEGGRNAIVRRTPEGRVEDVTAPPSNARTRVHEYGGGDFAVDGERLVFAELADQRLYLLDLRNGGGGAPRPLTADERCPDGPRWRYADLTLDPQRRRLICVREDHGAAEPGRDPAAPGGNPPHPQPVNAIVAVDLPPEGSAGHSAGDSPQRVLVAGNDFYASPRLSPDGRRLAWLTWNHPAMPWDGTTLWTAELTPDGSPISPQPVAGGETESVYQPEWGPDGRLYFVSDRSGWWNLYRLSDGGEPEALAPREAEFGLPQWVFGAATYGFLDRPDGAGDAGADPPAIVCAFTEGGVWHLGRLERPGGPLETIPTPYAEIRNLRVLPGDAVAIVAGSPTAAASLVRVDTRTGRSEVLRRSSEADLDPRYVSVPRAVTFPTTGGDTAHAFFYPPTNPDFRAPPGERPPLLVKSHGGPTSAAPSTLTLGVQFWTSRGVGVLDVNYGGSTGFGRAYRRRLEGQWGVVDVDDCLSGALALARTGEADPERLLISGGSAGGFTTLCALTFRDAFRAGASYYGVSDLERLATDTHKFESRYLDRLVGPYPQRRDLYLARSPIHHVHLLARPVVFFQGLEDAVVPPSQTETMVEALRARGLPVAYLPFAGEQHGFRRAEHIARAFDAELAFYARVLGFTLAEPVEPLAIENL